MSMGYRGKVTNKSREVIAVQSQMDRESQWGEIPGEIVSFDAEAQTAKVKPLFKPKHNGKAIDMPELEEVPVRFPRGGNGAITHPIKKGDKVVLRPGMRSSEKWHTEEDGEASDTRSFGLSDMEAHLDGGESLKDQIKNFDNANMHIRFDEEGNYGIRGNANGTFKIEGSQGNIYKLIDDAIDQCQQMASYLSQEPALIYTSQYASEASELATILGKLRGMEL